MMLHRHFENANDKSRMTKLADVTPHEIEEAPPDGKQEAPVEAPKRRGRQKKSDN